MQGNLLYTKATNKQNKTKQKTSSKWIDSSSEGHLQDFSSISQDFSSKIVIERGVYLTFDPPIQFSIFEEKPI